MNRVKNLIIAAVLFVLLISPACMFYDFCVSGTGRVTNEIHRLSDFGGISLSTSADVYFTQADNFSVEVEAYENIQSMVDLDVDNGVLEIDMEGCILTGNNVRVFVTAPDLSLIENSGSGTIYIDDVLNVRTIELKNYGSGDIQINDIIADYIEADLTGSGDIIVSGYDKCFEQNILLTGSGNYEAMRLESDDVQVRNSGSGDCLVWANETISGRLSGSGDIRYKGTARVTVSVTGSGRIISYN